MIALTAQEIAADAGGKLLQGPEDARVTSVCTDSRKIVPGCLFIALTGENFDGHGFCAAAAEQGAAAVLVSRPVDLPAGVAVILTEDSLLGLQRLAAAHRQRWGKFVIGLTGSNGKTSTKDLCLSVLSVAAKMPSAFSKWG
jgi:UDP-N-acetylmuramoyl-tripeptide--D-alanyl-D-alanine ligase